MHALRKKQNLGRKGRLKAGLSAGGQDIAKSSYDRLQGHFWPNNRPHSAGNHWTNAAKQCLDTFRKSFARRFLRKKRRKIMAKHFAGKLLSIFQMKSHKKKHGHF